MTRARAWLRDLVRAARWHRRLLAAGLFAGSVAFGLQVLAPPPPPTVPAVVAARDLPAGARLGPDHLDVARVPAGTLPDGAARAVAEVSGATLLSGVRRGELLTDVRLVGPAGVAGLGAGLVATPVRIADAEAARLVRPGAVVDVLAAGGGMEGGAVTARLVAAAVRVLAVPTAVDGDGFGGNQDGALVLLATTDETAARLAGAAVTDRLSLVLRGQ